MKKRSKLALEMYASGYSQKRIAKLANIDVTKLSAIACARRWPTPREQANLMKCLGKTAEELGFDASNVPR